MSSMSLIQIMARLNSLETKVVTTTALSNLLGNSNKNTIYKTIGRMEKNNLITKLIKGKYIVTDSKISDFEKAGIILSPSYISLESALSFYGILSQFPYSITSVTTQKSRKYEINGKEYEYTKISKGLYSDYTKKDGFLIATPEKALIDLIYLVSKGLRKIDLTELDMSIIDWEVFNKLKNNLKYYPFQHYIIRNKIYLKTIS